MGLKGLYRRLFSLPSPPQSEPPPLPPVALAPLWDEVERVEGPGFDPAASQRDLFVRFAAGHVPVTPPPLLTHDPRLVELQDMIGHGHQPDPVGDIGCFVLNDALYDPGIFAVLKREGVALQAGEIMAAYWRDEIVTNPHMPTRQRNLDRVIDETCIAFLTPHYLSYGSFLIDCLPRLWLARAMLGEAFDSVKILTDTAWHDWAWPLLAAAGVRPEQCIALSHGGGRARIARLILPTPMHQEFAFHRAAAGFFDAVPDDGPWAGPRRIYVPRPAADPLRRFANEDEIVGVAEACGLTAVEPWKLPWAQQVSLFRSAELVVGAYGSALHNTIFSGAGTRVVAFPRVNVIQSGIAAARRQQIAFIALSGRTQLTPERYFFTMDPDLVRLAIDIASAPVEP